MSHNGSIQKAVIGELLPDLGKRSLASVLEQDGAGGGSSRPRTSGLSKGLGGLERNVMRVPQSIVKRVAQGGTGNAKELRRQMSYITRDEALYASWSNLCGIEMSFAEEEIGEVADEWSCAWRGAPKRGHTDHIILSFPRGTEAETAYAISRDWAEEIFGSGDYQDRFAYVAALHHNTDQVHAHFIVNKHGLDHGSFLSISRYTEINYDMMRALHVDIAHDHGLALNATTRLSRLEIENAPRQSEVQLARREGREPVSEPLTKVGRTKRQAVIEDYRRKYQGLRDVAEMRMDGTGDSYLQQLFDRAQDAASHGPGRRALNMNHFHGAMAADSIDPEGSLRGLRREVIEQAERSWKAIRGMEPGAERADLEARFNMVCKDTALLLKEHEDLSRFATTLSPKTDPCHQPLAARLAERAFDEMNPLHAEADRSLQLFRASLVDRLSGFEADLRAAGSSAEELAARITLPSHSPGQIEALHAAIPVALRARYGEIEGLAMREAGQVATRVPIEDRLLEDMAHQEIREADPNDRMSELPIVTRMVERTYASLSDRELKRLEQGRGDVLSRRVHDPDLRHAITAEIKAIEELPDGTTIAERDSSRAHSYQTDSSIEERIREIHANRSLADDAGWSL